MLSPRTGSRLLSCLSLVCLLGVLLTPSFAAEAGSASAVPTFKRGISIGHWLAKFREGVYGGPWFGQADVAWIAQQGFDHIRYPVDGRLWLLADGSLDETKIAPFLQAVQWTREKGLGTVLDMHFLPGGSYDANSQDTAIYTDDAARAKAAEFWGKVARRFRDEGAWLRFELINEPLAPRNEQLNTLNLALLAAIRQTDRNRVVYVTSNESSSFTTLADVVMPDDPHVALLLHYDEPLIFTHQRTSWKHCPPDMPLVHFPDKVPDMTGFLPADHWAMKASGTELTVAEIEAAFIKVMRWVKQHAPDKEVYLGEFGCYEGCPADSRRAYIASVRAAAERHGWGWVIWDYKSSFAVRAADGKPTAVLEGLFQK